MEIGLGTVQFGIPYGISNAAGQTSPDEVASILGLAADSGVRLLDTARSYGSSEAVLGSAGSERFRVISKVPKFPAELPDSSLERFVFENVRGSLADLRRDSLSGLLAHDASGLLGPHGDRLWSAMEALRNQGLVEKCGASVYHPAEAEELIRRYPLRILQFPLSYLDQRFARGDLLSRLRKSGVELHVRSVFLQGLLLMSPETLPEHFRDVRPHLQRIHAEIRQLGFSPLDAALGFPWSVPGIDVVLCGVNEAPQLREILQAFRKKLSLPWSSYSWQDERVLLPSLWRKR